MHSGQRQRASSRLSSATLRTAVWCRAAYESEMTPQQISAQSRRFPGEVARLSRSLHQRAQAAAKQGCVQSESTAPVDELEDLVEDEFPFHTHWAYQICWQVKLYNRRSTSLQALLSVTSPTLACTLNGSPHKRVKILHEAPQ